MARSAAPKDPEFACAKLFDIIEEMVAEDKSLGDIAKEIGLHKSYVSKIFSRERTTVGVAALKTVADHLHIDMDYFESKANGHWRDFQELDEPTTKASARRVEQPRDAAKIAWILGEARHSLASVREWSGNGNRRPGSLAFESDAKRDGAAVTAYAFATNFLESEAFIVAEGIRQAYRTGDRETALRLAGTLAYSLDELLQLATQADLEPIVGPDEMRRAAIEATKVLSPR